MKNFKIPLDIYEIDVLVHIGKIEDFEDILVANKVILQQAPPESIGGLTAGACGKIFVYFPAFEKFTAKALRCITHEMTHVSWHVGMQCGEVFDMKTQEAQAYLMDYLVANCAKKMFKGFK